MEDTSGVQETYNLQIENGEKQTERVKNLFSLNPDEITQITSRIDANNGLVRIFVHPYFGVPNFDATPHHNKVTLALEKLLAKSEAPPLLVFEEKFRLDQTLDRLTKATEQSKQIVYFIPTNNLTSNPAPIPELSIQPDDMGRWDFLVDRLKEFRTTKVIIGGERLGVQHERIANNQEAYKSIRQKQGAKNTNYFLNGCVGHTIAQLTHRGIHIDISTANLPISRMDITNLENKT